MTELFVSGIKMGESPRWRDGRFWMCDWIAGEVLAFDAPSPETRPSQNPASQAIA
jgi:sugar lactone lactonase YvrE